MESPVVYAPEYLKEAAEQYAEVWQINEAMFVHGRGHRKTTQQRHYEKLKEYAAKLEEYVEKIKICGEDRNSYSKTDHSATFMRIKTDYMGNDQLFQLIMYRSVLQMNTLLLLM